MISSFISSLHGKYTDKNKWPQCKCNATNELPQTDGTKHSSMSTQGVFPHLQSKRVGRNFQTHSESQNTRTLIPASSVETEIY